MKRLGVRLICSPALAIRAHTAIAFVKGTLDALRVVPLTASLHLRSHRCPRESLVEEFEGVSAAIKLGGVLPRGVVSLAILPVHKHPKWFGSCWETEVKEGEGSKLPVRAGLLVATGFTGALGAARW